MSLGTIGKYELLEKLSQGGMGELFRARTSGPGGFERIVALKVILPAAVRDPHFVQMFVAEATVASLLSHQNLVHLYEFGSDGDVHYLAMEMVEGRDVAKILERCRMERLPFSIPIAVRTARDVALGLDHLHRLSRKGEPLHLIHRDVSPQNIMLSFDGAVKLTDFGIVRVSRRERITQLGVVKGKAGYLSPEQIMDVPLDGRADLFCLGIVLWECLTGARLFPGRTDLELITQILQRPIRPPSSLNSEVSGALDAVVMRALSREREGRFSSAQEMGQALGALGPELGADADIAKLLRQLFPESANERLLGLVSSVELVKAEVSEVRKFLGFPSEVGTGETKVDRPSEGVPEPVTELGGPGMTASTVSAPVVVSPDDVLTAPRPTRGRWRWGAVVAAGVGIALGASQGWIWRDAKGTSTVPSPTGSLQSSGIPTALAAEPRHPTDPSPPPVAINPPGALEDASAHTPSPAEPKPASRKRPAPRQGTLAAVQIRPWAEVSIDGHAHSPRWFTPGRWPLAPGHHQITLSNPNVGVERHFEVDVRAGRTVTLSGPLESLQPESEE